MSLLLEFLHQEGWVITSFHSAQALTAVFSPSIIGYNMHCKLATLSRQQKPTLEHWKILALAHHLIKPQYMRHASTASNGVGEILNNMEIQFFRPRD